MILALIIALPFMGALLPLLAERGGRTLCAASAGVAPLIGLVLLLGQRGTVFAGQTLTASYSWLPEIGINLSLRLDGLGFLFALLILGIGLLVILYARYYLSEQEPMGRFFAFLLLFMGSMLGVVLAENLLLMMLFWELTSLSSFLLIGFWGSRSDARKGARMALTVTGGGGLALLAGVLLLGHIAGSFELTEVLAAGELIRAHALYPLVLILILLGVFTKSAQFPLPFLAAPRDGGADPGFRVPALGDHGQGRRVPAGPAVSGAGRHRVVLLPGQPERPGNAVAGRRHGTVPA